MRIFPFLLIFGMSLGIAFGTKAQTQQNELSPIGDASSVVFSQAALRAAIIYPRSTFSQKNSPSFSDEPRSIPLAFGASALVPGAGQFYNGQKVKAVVALAIEAAIITGYSVMKSRGNDAELAFQNVAHASWDPAKYASWLNDYTEFLTNEHGASVSAPSINTVTGIDFQQPSSWTQSERAEVQRMFDQMTTVERQLFHPETGAVFSHQIPDFAAQQYYELIGKYFQFAPGWSDYPEWKDADGNFLVSIDPEHTGVDGSKPNVSSSFFSYANEHADAQDMLRRASQISLLLVFNHLIAGIDAAVNAKLHNDRLETRMGLAYDPSGRPVPITQLKIRF